MKLFFAFLLIFFAVGAHSKPGPEVPLPKLSHQEAFEIAHAHLQSEKYIHDKTHFLAKEYILMSLQYVKNQGSWVWQIRFAHPVANDHSVTFKVSQAGKVINHVSTM